MGFKSLTFPNSGDALFIVLSLQGGTTENIMNAGITSAFVPHAS
jgi:hypothetical protein